MSTKQLGALWSFLLAVLVAIGIWSAPARDEQKAIAAEEQGLSVPGERIAGSYKLQDNLIVLMYHDLSEEPPEDKELFTTAEKFAADIDALQALGYLPISLEDYYFGQAEADKKYFAITFDDGYQGVYNFAYPVLLEKQVPAAVFFNTSMEHQPAFIHYWQLQEMEESGLVKIYSHLAYHMAATKLPEGEFERYLDASVRFLNKYVGEKPMFLAYPYGDYNREVHQIAVEHGICLQFVQLALFVADDVLVRINVPYDADMAKLVRKAVHN